MATDHTAQTPQARLRELAERLQRQEHYRAMRHVQFAVSGREPHGSAFPGNVSLRFEDCVHPDCQLARQSEAPPPAIERIVQRVAELPDRTSPDDWPEAMLVTADELRDILQSALTGASEAPPTQAPTLLGCPVVTVADEEWPHGVPKDTIALIAPPTQEEQK